MSKIKIKMERKVFSSVLLIVVLSLVIMGLAILYMRMVPKPEDPITSIIYDGQLINFRADLREADKVPVYPGETQVYLDTIHPLVDDVTIAFKDAGEEDNPLYMVEVIEIVTKMTPAYRKMLSNYNVTSEEDMPEFNATPVEQYAWLPGKIQNPIIAVVHPKYANETAVRNEGHVTYISGTTKENLDLATVKFLMIVLGIEMEYLEPPQAA
jgi:hypothetical protein